MNEARQFTAKSAGAAIDMVLIAHRYGMAASYAPLGGLDANHDEPIVHRVVVVADTIKINGWQTLVRQHVIYYE